MFAILTRTATAVLCVAALAVASAASASSTLTTSSIVSVPCSAAALSSAIADASTGQILNLTRLCNYRLAAPLPPVSTNLTIRGNMATVERSDVPGTQDFTILDVMQGSNMAIRYLIFRDAVANQQGVAGAIQNAGNLTVTGGSFVGNTTTGYGGAIQNSGTLKVINVTFSNNMSADGGAIENLGISHIIGSKFIDNEAVFNGGAFHNEGRTTVKDSLFTGNSAASDGGGIFVGVDGNVSTITSTTFRQNRATSGGGIYNEDTVSLTGTVVSENDGSDQGGGIYSDWLLTLTNSQVDSNIAAAGGGIYNGNLFGPPGSVTMTGSTVLDNRPDNCEPVSSISSCSDPAAVTQRPGPDHANHAWGRPLTRSQALARDFRP